MAKRRKAKKAKPAAKKKKRAVKRKKKSPGLMQSMMTAVSETVGLRKRMNKGRFEGS